MPGLITDLHLALLRCDSATAVLERFFGGPILVRRQHCAPVAPDAAQTARLELGQGTPWQYRRVCLLSAGTVLSEAHLWFVPGRLLPGMVQALAGTEIPFGRIVAPLRPRRHSIVAAYLPSPSPYALQHRAVLVTDAGPIAEVNEFYPASLDTLVRAG